MPLLTRAKVPVSPNDMPMARGEASNSARNITSLSRTRPVAERCTTRAASVATRSSAWTWPISAPVGALKTTR